MSNCPNVYLVNRLRVACTTAGSDISVSQVAFNTRTTLQDRPASDRTTVALLSIWAFL